MKSINVKIKAVEVVQSRPQAVLPDINPLEVRIDRRPEGELAGTTEKVQYSTQEGKKSVYIVISYLPVTGRLDGKEIVVERPIEFFLPIGQHSEEHQWITATMRSLSLAARGGYCARALQDLSKVSWTKGPVRCGQTDYGNGKVAPNFHDSEVAAIAWSIQQSLIRRGYLDGEGNEVSFEKLVNKAGPISKVIDFPSMSEAVESPQTGTLCDNCKQHTVVFESGCAVCKTCGDSKCG